MQIPTLVSEKLDLIDFAFSRFDLHSFADLGGVWGIDGGYTFYALESKNVSTATLVDTQVSEAVNGKALKYSQLKLLEGNFGDEMVARQIDGVDAIFLFDVLLHQVAPDWNRVLELYSTRTKCFVIYNQQWVGSDQTVRLLELGEEEYFRNVPADRNEAPYDGLFEKLEEELPDHGRLWKNVHHIWQWGITNADLISKVESLGFRLQYMKNCGRFGLLENFENHAFVFTRR